MDTYFRSDEHKQRLLATMRALGKVYGSRLDAEYAAALYILQEDEITWNVAVSKYVSRHGIDFDAMLDFSGGYSVLIKLAGHLFNGLQRVEPLDLLRLDDGNFAIALEAMRIRRVGLRVQDLQ